jgi:hypothetical protein
MPTDVNTRNEKQYVPKVELNFFLRKLAISWEGKINLMRASGGALLT